MNTDKKELYMYALGSIIVIGFFITLIMLIYVPMKVESEKMLYLFMGALVAKFGTIVDYFYGSSKGSSDKTKLFNTPEKND